TTQSGAVANYNGVTVSLREQYHNWIMAHINYTYSHAHDEVSNGGLFPIGNSNATGFPGADIQTQINPTSLRANNYGNADYDIRNLFSADYVITPPTHFENKFARAALGGWQWSGKIFARSGLPFSVIDGNAAGQLAQGGVDVAVAQQILPGAQSGSCGVAAAYTNANPTNCLNASA